VTIGGLALLMSFRAPEEPIADVALAIEPGTVGSTDSGVEPDPSSEPGVSPSVSPSPDASASSPSASPTLEPTASPSATVTTRTATGSAFEFRFGTVQVAVTLQGDDITEVQALQLPDGDRRSLAISQQVEPMLRESALAADSADIDVISGATYTSLAYAYSLQSALDQLAAG
jgi:uncharacterized protein with FMN-binding domain